MGPLMYDDQEDEVFLGRSYGHQKTSVSGDTAKKIDEEVRLIIDDCYGKAEIILKEREDILHAMAEALIKFETLDADQIADLMARRPVREPEYWNDNSSNTKPNSPSADDSSTKTDEKPAVSPIGGPAGEH
jgi:cell division protease FtsH